MGRAPADAPAPPSEYGVYARTSGEEETTGQDVDAQALVVLSALQQRGDRVGRRDPDDGARPAVFKDDGVSGDTDPFDRRGFRDALAWVRARPGRALAMTEVSRFTRCDPDLGVGQWRRLSVVEAVPVLALKDSIFSTADRPDPPEGVGVGIRIARYVTLAMSHHELVTTRWRTQQRMDGFKDGAPTKSGKPHHRPPKEVAAELVDAALVWVDGPERLSVVQAAHRLSEARGAFRPGVEGRERDRLLVSRTLLTRLLHVRRDALGPDGVKALLAQPPAAARKP